MEDSRVSKKKPKPYNKLKTDELISELHDRYHIVFPSTIKHLIKCIIDKITKRYWKRHLTFVDTELHKNLQDYEML